MLQGSVAKPQYRIRSAPAKDFCQRDFCDFQQPCLVRFRIKATGASNKHEHVRCKYLSTENYESQRRKQN